ncbi:hypothetical protein [Bacillus sp. ISL-4]|nr:hypothetical protein [Bacillus sp. ISL-4]
MGYVREKLMITTERLVLRLFQTSDATAVATLCNNYNISNIHCICLIRIV